MQASDRDGKGDGVSVIKRAAELIEKEVEKMTQAPLDTLMQRGIDAAYEYNAPESVRDEMLREWKGGKCPECGRPYVLERVSNIFAEFEYYRPDCRCVAEEEAASDKAHDLKIALLMAGVPKTMVSCDFAGWDYGIEDQTNAAMKIVYEYVETAAFSGEKRQGLVCYGEVGTGKTHCAIAALRAMAGGGYTIQFCQMSELVKKLIDKEADAYMGQLMRTYCVLFDDLDKVSTYKSEWVRDQVFNLFDKRIGEKKLLMATTNLTDPDEFLKRFGEATTSRLLGACQWVEFKGRDYRQVRKGRA